MSVATITEAQRAELRDAALTLAKAAQQFCQDGRTPTTAESDLVQPILDACALAVQVAGGSGGSTSAVVANGGTVNVENSAGNLDSPATAIVAAGAVSGVRLAATKTILTNATKFSGVTITGTGNFFTPTVANGVLTGGVLSAS